jgi:hypothetical protein
MLPHERPINQFPTGGYYFIHFHELERIKIGVGASTCCFSAPLFVAFVEWLASICLGAWMAAKPRGW